MSTLTEQLAGRGNDMAGALARFLDDEALYGDCFRMFLEDPGFRQLEDALARRDTSAAFDAAHTLKGVAGNLGLTALYTALSALVQALRQGRMTGTSGLLQAVQAERNSLVPFLSA